MTDTDTSEAADDADADEDAPKKRNKLALILAALVAVLIVGGGGAAAWFLVLAPSDDVVAEVEAEPAPVPPPPAPGFVAVDWLVIQTRGEHRQFRDLSFLVTLEVDGAGFDNATVAQAMPKLRDAFLLALTETPLVDGPAGRVDAREVKARLQAAADHVLGAGLVHDVLIQQIQDTAA